jgi:uncharacterized protein YdaU (DUF1376 family)
LIEKARGMGENEESGPNAVEAAPAPDHTPADGGRTDMAIPQRNTAPAFQFYPKDFLSSSKVELMSMTERGVYITLLSRCWLDNGLPDDVGVLARLVGMKQPQFARMWAGPLHECFHGRDGKLHNRRLDEERKKQVEFRRRQSDNGKRGGRPKKPTDNPSLSPDKAVGISGLSQTKPKKSSPISDLQSSSARESARARPAPLVQRRRLDAAYEGPRGLYVLQTQHGQFVASRNGNEAEVLAFYETVAEAWGHGERRNDNIDPNMPRFWNERYAEHWPPAKAKPKDAGPTYIKATEHPYLKQYGATKAGA